LDSETVRNRRRSGISLAKVIEEFVSDLEWKEMGENSLETRIEIRNQGFDLHVEGDERRERLSLFLYAPFSVIEGKYVDACMLFSYINSRHPRGGRLYAFDDGTIGFTHVLNAEDGGELTTQLVMNMTGGAISMFESHGEAIATVALTSRTYEAIRTGYEERDRKRKEDPREWTPEPVYRKLKDG